MEVSILTEMVKQLPAVGAVIFIVLVFLRSAKEERESRQSQDERREEVINKLERDSQRFQSSMMERLEASTKQWTLVVERNTEMFFRTNNLLERIEDMIDNVPIGRKRGGNPPGNPPPPRQ